MKNENAGERPSWEAIHKDVHRILNAVLQNGDDARTALTFAWDAWQNAPNCHASPSWWATLGMRRLVGNREIQGMPARRSDPFLSLVNWGGGGMEGLADPSADHTRIVMNRELFDVFLSRLSTRQWAVAELLMAGYTTSEAARALKITQGAVSQHRRSMLNLWREIAS